MAQLIQVFVIVALLLPVFLWRDNNFHASRARQVDKLVYVIASIGQQRNRVNTAYEFLSKLAIRRGTCCNKYSDWITIRIHGQMYLGIEPPFVRSMS